MFFEGSNAFNARWAAASVGLHELAIHGRRVRARGRQASCRPRALTRCYRELLKPSASASERAGENYDRLPLNRGGDGSSPDNWTGLLDMGTSRPHPDSGAQSASQCRRVLPLPLASEGGEGSEPQDARQQQDCAPRRGINAPIAA